MFRRAGFQTRIFTVRNLTNLSLLDNAPWGCCFLERVHNKYPTESTFVLPRTKEKDYQQVVSNLFQRKSLLIPVQLFILLAPMTIHYLFR